MQSSARSQDTGTGLVRQYREARALTETLCEPLETEDYVAQPIVDVSPAKWNIAHTTWFFEELILKKHFRGYRVFDDHFSHLFNSYYNTVGNRTARDRRGDMTRPTVKRVFEYRKYVDGQMAELLANGVSDDIAALVKLGINHEQQHQELFLTDLKYTLSLNPLFPVYREGFAPEEDVESADAGFVELEAGIYEIGHEGDGFCFDNEMSRHKVYIDDIEISVKLVTNAEYVEFINAGGYGDFRLWHAEGWDWVTQNQIEAPLYWHHRTGGWAQFTLAGLRKVVADAPVCHISYYEASAYAEWKGMRLPTEAEWEVASGRFQWGKRWEWTGSAYLPYPGFKKPAGAVGEYNGKFMVNQMVLRGGSVATTCGHTRPTYRNFFHPHLRWQFTGIRLAR